MLPNGPPAWLVSRARYIGGLSYMIKMITIMLLCILLGLSLSGLYRGDTVERMRNSNMKDFQSFEDGRKSLDVPEEYMKSSDVNRDIFQENPEWDTAKYGETKLKPWQSKDEKNTLSKVTDKWISWAQTAKHKFTGPEKQSKRPTSKQKQKNKGKQKQKQTAEDADSIHETVIEPNISRVYGERPTLGKVTIVTGNDDSQSVWERALRTHAAHNKLHHYQMYVLRQSILRDVWSKPAYILSVILRELAKPVAERLEWLLWVDADTIVINPYIPAEIFLPPPQSKDIHLLVTKDFNGLNNGIFPIRVHEWSVELLSAVVAYPQYFPDEYLTFRDQSALSNLIEKQYFKKHTVEVPQRWFNAYQGEVNETIAPFQVRRGDFLVHFAGVGDRDQRMEYWLDRAEEHNPEWEIEFKYTSYATEVKDFWHDEAVRRTEEKKRFEKVVDKTRKLKEDIQDGLRQWSDKLKEDQKKEIEAKISDLDEVMTNDRKKEDENKISEAVRNLNEAAAPMDKLSSRLERVVAQEAHEVLYMAEKATLENNQEPEWEEETKGVDEVLLKLKDKLHEKPLKVEEVRGEIEELRSRNSKLKKKIEEKKDAVEARHKEEEEASNARDEKKDEHTELVEDEE